ncbi:hypothetical protein HDU91_005356 [Kappamyces sp. JEL0680]|nr:hypothetical protein HDU91_005356 [Kappamyces sp. JEL0680]
MANFTSTLLHELTNSGMAWTQIIGCFWLFFAFCISNKKFLWQILFVHAVTGFLGSFVENTFLSVKQINPASSVGILLGFNEICWILNESSTAIYSLTKLETILQDKARNYVRIAIGIMLLGYAGCRVAIGILRTNENSVGSDDISAMHSYAFLFLAIIEMIIFCLLAYSTVKHLQSFSDRRIGDLMKTLFTSSIPRFLIIVLNTIVIVICGQFYSSPSQTVKDVNDLAWAIKGSYPIILLFDVLTTKNKLMETAKKSSDPDSYSTHMTSAPKLFSSHAAHKA